MKKTIRSLLLISSLLITVTPEYVKAEVTDDVWPILLLEFFREFPSSKNVLNNIRYILAYRPKEEVQNFMNDVAQETFEYLNEHSPSSLNNSNIVTGQLALIAANKLKKYGVNDKDFLRIPSFLKMEYMPNIRKYQKTATPLLTKMFHQSEGFLQKRWNDLVDIKYHPIDRLKQSYPIGRLNWIKNYPGNASIYYGSLIGAATILLKNMRNNRVNNQAEFIINNYEPIIKKLIDENKNVELAQQLQKGAFSWISRIKLFSFHSLSSLTRNIVNDFVKSVIHPEDMLCSGIGTPIEYIQIKYRPSRLASKRFLFRIVKNSLLEGGALWFLMSKLDERQAKLTADYIIKNKKALDDAIATEEKYKDQQLSEIRKVLNKSYGSIFKELGSFVLFEELYNFTKEFVGI